MNNYLIQNIIFGISLLVLDGIFIYNVILGKYITLFKNLNITMKKDIFSALITYVILISSFYIIYNAGSGSTKDMILRAALLGLAIYGTYAFTLCTILPYYDYNLAIVDTLWGVFLFTMSTVLTIIISRFFIKETSSSS
jgi:uncharacterized membrane protein